MRQLISVSALAALAVSVGGCTVTPTPLLDSEVSNLAISNLQRMTADQEPLNGPLDLYDAMARALKYNLDHRVEEMATALRLKELDLAHYSMLPSVVENSGYAARDTYNASNSVNILTGSQSLATSTSQDRQYGTNDITFSWNVLDFGLSYVRARQAADKYLISEELRRKVISHIIEDVRTAYWRAVSADRLIYRLSQLEARIRRALANAKGSSSDRQTSPITAVTYERELVEIKRSIQELQRDLSVAHAQLAALMNVTPGTHFVLSGGGGGRVPNLDKSVAEMIETALRNRSELKEVWYQRRINQQELDAALLELLPGLTPYVGTNYDSNDFLYSNHWLSWGAKASWNVMKLVQYPARRDVIEAQDHQLDARSLAVTMAVVTQVHVSRIRFLQYRKELQTANEYFDVQRRLLGLVKSEVAANRASEQTLIREEMNTLVAEARRDIIHAGMQNAYAGIYASMGLDPYASEVDPSLDVTKLAAKIRRTWLERDGSGRGA